MINLLTILYIFGTMVFIYMLLIGHESTVNKEDVHLLEVFLLFVNGKLIENWVFFQLIFFKPIYFSFSVIYIYLWHQVYMFSRQLYLDGRTSLEGILQNGYDSSVDVWKILFVAMTSSGVHLMQHTINNSKWTKKKKKKTHKHTNSALSVMTKACSFYQTKPNVFFIK